MKDLQLQLARAWAAKGFFTQFWQYQEACWARRLFKDWFGWLSRSRPTPMVAVARMLQWHLEKLLAYLKHHSPNAVTEGLAEIISKVMVSIGFKRPVL